MIVDPDFFDHWRTRMLADALDDEMAPIYVQRIWGHCQQRKGTEFAMPAAGIKAICRAKCDAQTLEDALIASGFIERDGAVIKVPKWADHNASLIAAWGNGGKGGRPAKSKPQVTNSEPDKNPTETHGLPSANQDATHAKPIREEKRREEKKNQEPPYSPPEGALLEREAIEYLNVRSGRSFEPVEASLRLVRARFKDGATPEQIRAVIDAKVAEWAGTEFEQYLRPATIFNAAKFASYAGALNAEPPRSKASPWWTQRGFGNAAEAIAAGERVPA